jgi:hypothetical protein
VPGGIDRSFEIKRLRQRADPELFESDFRYFTRRGYSASVSPSFWNAVK